MTFCIKVYSFLNVYRCNKTKYRIFRTSQCIKTLKINEQNQSILFIICTNCTNIQMITIFVFKNRLIFFLHIVSISKSLHPQYTEQNWIEINSLFFLFVERNRYQVNKKYNKTKRPSIGSLQKRCMYFLLALYRFIWTTVFYHYLEK